MSRSAHARPLSAAVAAEVRQIWRRLRRRPHAPRPAAAAAGPRAFAIDPLEPRVMLTATIDSFAGDDLIYEGRTAVVEGSFSYEPGTDDVDGFRATVDWGDGTGASDVTVSYGDGFGSFSGSHFYADNGQYTANVELLYAGGEPNATWGIGVENVRPTLTLTGGDTVDEGAPYTFDLAASGDPGPDTVTSWSLSWTDGTPTQTVLGAAATVQHTFAPGAARPLLFGFATDEDGTYTLTPRKAVMVVPRAPTGLAATAVPAAGRVDLAWADNSTVETGYAIERRDVSAGGDFAPLASVAAGVTTYQDTTASAGAVYAYRVRAVNATAGGTPVYSAFAPELAVDASGPGTGLAATYYDNLDFTGPVVTRTDAGLDFLRPDGQAPAAGIGAYTFAAQWSGRLLAPTTGTYTFEALSDDGVRLWVDGQLVLNDWDVHSPSTRSGTVDLAAGMHDVRAEYFQNYGAAELHLRWVLPGSAPGTAAVTVPAAYLYAEPPVQPPPAPAAPTAVGVEASRGLEPGTTTRLQVKWTDAPGADVYALYRSADFGATWSVAGSMVPEVGAFSDDLAQLDTAAGHYQYRLMAAGAGGRSAPVDAVAAPASLTVTGASDHSVDLAFTPVDDEVEVQRSSDAGATWALVGVVPGAEGKLQDLNGVQPGTTYLYRAFATRGFVTSLAVSATARTSDRPAAGDPPPAHGVRARYYAGATPTGTPAADRYEAGGLDFAWGNQFPPTGAAGGGTWGDGDHAYSAVFTGQIDLPQAGDYTFRAPADGGVRLRVDGQLVIDHWVDQPHMPGDANGNSVVEWDDLRIMTSNYNKTGMTFEQGDFTGEGVVNFGDLLTLSKNYNKVRSRDPGGAGTLTGAAAGRHDVRLEYFNDTGFGSVGLEWQYGGMANPAVVPAANWYPENAHAPTTVTLTGAAVTIDEGGSVPVTLSATADGDPIHEWVVHAGGQDFSFAGNPTTVDVPFANDGSFTITAHAIGDSGSWYAATGSVAVTVNNVAPALGSIAAQTAKPGQWLAFSAPLTDSGTADVHTATVDWGDGSPVEAAGILEDGGSGTVYANHAYQSAGVFTVTFTATDGKASVTRSATVTVSNAGPSMSPLAPQTIQEGDEASVIANFTDADADDVHTATIDWGDGNAGTAAVYFADGAGSVVASHTYLDDGTYTATVTLADGSGASVVQTKTVTVTNVAPKVDLGGFVQRYEAGGDVSLSPDIYDPGLLDTFTYEWTINDTSGNTLGTSTGEVLTMTTPAVGSYLLTLRVTDNGGGVGLASASVVIYPTGSPPSPVAPNAPSGLSIGSASPDGVHITWTDNSTDEDGFVVEWSRDGSEYFMLDVVPPNSTSYDDRFPFLNQDNFYRVLAFTDQADSAPSNVDDEKVYTADAAFWDDDGGYNGRDTLSPFAVVHDHVLEDANVFGNDLHFAQELSVTVNLTTGPSHGTLQLDPDGTFTYTPAAKFIGTDTFTYTVDNGRYVSAPATVAIDVTNELPIAGNQDKNLEEDGESGRVSATDPDGDPVTLVLLDAPDPGSGEFHFDATTGDYRFTPGPGFKGYARFTYAAKDGIGDLKGNQLGPAGMVAFRMPTLPATNGYLALVKDQPEAIWPSNEFAHLEIVTAPAHGTFVDTNPNPPDYGTVYYQPAPGYVGTDTFTARWVHDYGYKSQPFTYQIKVVDSAPIPPNHMIAPVRYYFPVNAVEPTTFTSGQSQITYLDPTKKVKLLTDAVHGKVKLLPSGAFTYTPNRDEQYEGFDYFSIEYAGVPENPGPNWIALSVGYPPQEPQPPYVFEPNKFPNTLAGVWAAFMQAKDKIGPVLQKMEYVGQIAKQISQSTEDPSELLQSELAEAVDGAAKAYAAYSKSAQAAFKAMGEYKAHQYIITGWDNDVFQAINSLPRDIAGLKPTQEQSQKWASAIAADARGTDFMVANANMVVQMAKDTHKAMETALYAGGLASMAITGAEIATQKGCTEFLKWATRAVVGTGVGIGVNAGAQGAVALAKKYGLPVNEEYVQIAADGIQLFFLVKAARDQRRAAMSNCFVAGTQVLTGSRTHPNTFSEMNIENVKVGDLVWSKDQYDPDSVMTLKRVTETFAHAAYDLQTVSIMDEDGNVETLHVTDEHPFFVDGAGWTAAAELTVGQSLISPDGATLTVTRNLDEKHAEGVTVYNFEVEDAHTYFVADGVGRDSFVWVHNKCSINQMNKDIAAGRAPRTVVRADKGKIQHEQDHVHFSDGSALNRDGTWKHGPDGSGTHQITNAEQEWLDSHDFFE